MSKRVPMPVGPLAMYGRSRSLQSVLAMSRWTQGYSPTNLLRNTAAVIIPPPPRHVLGGGQNADQMQRQAQPGGGPYRRQDFRAPGHVRFHLLHVLGRLQGDAARIEGDRLSHQHDRLGVPVLPPCAAVPLI